jgi:hypothetical protein
MPSAMILLVGEQPAPNLLPTRRLKPDVAVLVLTERTRRVAENLARLLKPVCRCLPCPVDPYKIPEIQDDLQKFLSDNLPEHTFTFNLTGGTKPMALAAFCLAKMHDSPIVYFQTEGNRSLLYHYVFDGDEVALQDTDDLAESISLDDYLRLHLGAYETQAPRNTFEQQVFETLAATPGIAEVFTSVRPRGLGALEVDFAVRCGNQVGIGEVKSKGAKDGIDQINAVADPRYLGTYVRKFLLSAHPVHPNNQALAQAYRIEVIELPSYGETDTLDTEDRQKLGDAVLRRMGGGR